MSLHLQRDLEALKKEILQLGNLVETAINTSIQALNNREIALADRVFELEEEINEKEVHIEEECLKILALHQQVAVEHLHQLMEPAAAPTAEPAATP